MSIVKKRVYELVKGDCFLMLGTRYIVIEVQDSEIIYAYLSKCNEKHSFGRNCQAKVEIIPSPKPPETIKELRNLLPVDPQKYSLENAI